MEFIIAVRHFATRLLLVFCLTVSVGGHWGILQSIAWVKMTADYSREQSLTSAVEKVFSGKAPCNLCLLISKEKKNEQKNEMLKTSLKLDYLWSASDFQLFVPQIEPDELAPEVLASQTGHRPPSPPPRAA